MRKRFLMYFGSGGIAAPAQPTGLTVTPVSTSQIDLAWTDNATNETAYRVYRSTDAVNYSQVGSDLAADANSYSDTTITSGTTYYYKVAAVNAVGETLSDAAVTNTLLYLLVFSALLNEASGNRLDTVGGNVLIPENTPAQGAPLAANLSNSTTFVAASNQYLHDDTPSDGVKFGDVDFTVAQHCNVTADGALVGRWYTTTPNRSWLIDRASGALRFGMSADGSVSTYHAVSGPSLPSGTPCFVMCSHDSVNDLLYAQVNNGAASSAAHSGGAFAASSAALTVGATANPSLYINGGESNPLMWLRLLTADEKTALYNGGAGFPHPFL